MELVLGGLLMGASGMLALLIIAVRKDPVSRQSDSHSPQGGV